MTIVDAPVTLAVPVAEDGPACDRVRHPPRTPPATWWQTEQSREDLLERLLSPPLRPGSAEVRRCAQRGLAAVLGWLEQHSGQTWQDRWSSSGAEQAGRDWIAAPLRQMEALNGRLTKRSRNDVLCAMRLLLCGQVLRPAYSWLLRYRPSTLLEEARSLIDPGGFSRLRAHCEATGRRNRLDRMSALNRITWILLNKGGAISDITVGDCVELNTALREHQSRCADSRHLFYTLLAETGVLPAASPPTLKAAQMPGQLTIAQLVDRHGVQSVTMRGLLTSYLAERAPEMDYISLDRLATTLCGLFWRDLERHHPGIDSPRLDPEVAVAWKERLGKLRDEGGRIIRDRADPRSKLLIVRAFYLDIARWAAEDPARWGQWAAPCPIKANECSLRKLTARRKAAMDQRTRARLPVLPTLVRTAERERQAAKSRLDAALATPAEEVFETAAGHFRRWRGEADRVYVTDLTTGRRRDLTFEDDRAFWSWATIEVLRHTGIRIEEMLELTHHSFIAYKLPSTGEVVPMLQIVPSKTDSERLLLVSPELGEVLAEVIHRVRDGRAVLPLVAAYDPHERTWSPPTPLLFQRRRGPEQRALSRAFIRRCLNDTLATSGLTDATGKPLFFTPHDFRRLLSA